MMVDAEAQTEPPAPAAVVGLEQDALMGVRVRKSFGLRVFWGSVVGCYWVSGGLFYKVSFDDGDVDILAQDEVVQDAQAAKKHAKENPQINEKNVSPVLEDYWRAMRQHSLKRKRGEAGDNLPPGVCRVTLWGQRLYASIYTNEHNETFVKELLRTEEGQVGEMEASGKVQVGDMILAVNKTRALGLPSIAVAELIRKPTRPVTITFYRPNAQQRGAAQAPVTTEQTQLRQEPVPTTQQAPAPAPASAPAPAPRPVVMPPTFTVPQSAFRQPGPLAQGLGRQWTQPSQPQGLSNREIIRQRLAQNAAARQAGYVTGYSMGAYAAPAQGSQFGVPAAHGGSYQAQQQYMQSVLQSAATRISSGFHAPAGQQARPMHRPQHAVPVDSSGFNQPPRTLYEQVHQMRAQRTSRPAEVNAPPPAERRNGAEVQFAVTSQGMTSTQPARTSDRMPTGSAQIPHARTIHSVASSSNSAAQSSLSFVGGVEAIAALAQRDPKAASQAMGAMRIASQATSFLSPSEPAAPQAATSQTASFLSPSDPPAENNPPVAQSTAAASHPTSFLSPNDFNMESSTPSREERSAGTAPLKPEPVESNVSLVSVEVQRRRLYLTLGMQGTLVAVTSFVKDEFGKAGEVELSGKVFLGDVLVRVGETAILPGTTPSDVADVVSMAPRPMTLHFERASWDILDGKE